MKVKIISISVKQCSIRIPTVSLQRPVARSRFSALNQPSIDFFPRICYAETTAAADSAEKGRFQYD